MVLYRTYLRHQIRQYLYRHADMPPKAIVLVALLMPEESTEDQTSTSDSDPARQASHSSFVPDVSGQPSAIQALLITHVQGLGASVMCHICSVNKITSWGCSN